MQGKIKKFISQFTKTSFFSFLVLHFFILVSSVGAQEHAAESHGNPGPDLALIFKEINFLIFAVLLFLLLRKPVRDYFASRAASIRLSIDESRKAFEKAQEENEEISTRLQNIEKETAELIKTFKEEGEIERKKIIEQAQSNTEKLKDDLQRIAESELTKANEELKAMTVQLSKELATNMIKQEIGKEDNDRLTKNYIGKLKKMS